MELELVPMDAPEYGEGNDAQAEEKPVYDGPDRRKYNRRVTPDRRAMVRFEETADRRKGGDRRKSQKIWNTREL